ncbi:hypothetical protein [Pelomonas sp. BJYL3]|uniref:hypothetical protein n=1 Tax=Pelomonas sp. BJYL3 TaxID=2976697 RepID=UPI0022B479B4|nr:hypothetical protein [Pelomonas sp. BJYL3]
MSNKSITDLRATLFDILAGVKDGTIDIDRARAANDVAKTIVDTAKVEVDYLRTVGSGESGFIVPEGDKPKLPAGITGVTRHRLAG